MATHAQTGARYRGSPFGRDNDAPSPGPPPGHARSKSAIMQSPLTKQSVISHTRTNSLADKCVATMIPTQRPLSMSSSRQGSPGPGTFAPKFIKGDLDGTSDKVGGIEGENDFSGKRYVWVKDAEKAFVKAWVVEEPADSMLKVQYDDGSQRDVEADAVDKVNPAKFDKADDMAELTHLNEASVVHNLQMRYNADLIYTYSGLFLVTVNPYTPLPIYGRDFIKMYKGRSREESKPHIFAVADEAFRNLVEEGTNQSILVTGESGAGKTENTKKVIQYLASVANSETPRVKASAKQISNLSEQILRANPILEAFGNAQTVRNHNSSRFGKFIRIEFTRTGQIAGAFIDWYLLEKSRVVKVNEKERNYHIFYQLLQGADRATRERLLLGRDEVDAFEYTKHGNDSIPGVSDQSEWNSLIEAFHVMGFNEHDQDAILQTIGAILHLGNIMIGKESLRGDQASIDPKSMGAVEKFCRLAGIPTDLFVKGLLHPKVKAGREWVEKVQTPEQVRLAIDALAKGIYERGFGDLVNRINSRLDRSAEASEDTYFIGVLDIAGFEIFENNSFEQLCINYTNEKLQQFFNHHMFVLEQEEYAREQIDWKFIDFGRDLQPAIDLIELTNPIGIFSCLDEDSVMPKATDKSFTDKLHSLWNGKTPKYRKSLLNQGFMLTHYAADVEYSTDGWLEKNKDPLNDNVTRLLAASTDGHMSRLFADCAEVEDDLSGGRSKVKRGLFRTVAQRHKEQLSSLMGQLHSTHPHFVRCILPNHKKRPKQWSAPLVLDQLRCNGVLEGIRIARTGFPNRLPFAEFRARYEVLCPNMPKGYIDGQAAAKLILEKLRLDPSWFRVGITKVFFRAGVLAELEEQRDALIQEIISRFQSIAKGHIQRKIAHKRLYRAEATRIIQRNFQAYAQMQGNPWWTLFTRMRPLLGATRQATEVKKREEEIKKLQMLVQEEEISRQRVEEERRRAENDIQRIQQTLESERALALDKEEIFKRLQSRENELTEKLQDAIADQDHLEEQIDGLMSAKKSAEERSSTMQRQLEQAGAIISNLENEKQGLKDRISHLDQQIVEVEQTKSLRSEAEEKLDQEIKMLQSHLSLKERKMQDLESKLLAVDQDMALQLSSTNKDLQASKKQARDLQEENRSIREQMRELSSTSTSFEDVIRQKDSELTIMKTDLKKFQDDRRRFEDEKRQLTDRHDSLQSQLRGSLAEAEAMRSQHLQLKREASDAKRALEEQANATSQAEILESQIHDLKAELFQVQTELSRERQSRDDVKKIADSEIENIRREFNALNESKVTIEREMYAQSDITRRASEAKAAADQERKEYQTELQRLRREFIELQEAKIDAEAAVESRIMKQASDRQAILRRELDDKDHELRTVDIERASLAGEVQRLKNLIADSDNFKVHHDQHKDRLERELVTVKGRLTASENDNRALLNKIQQKNLDIARSNSKAGDIQRTRMSQVVSQKTKADDDVKRLTRQLGDAQLTISSLEKQKEKLALSLEDMNHEMSREHRTTRNAEQASSTVNLQLADANRKLETERQLRSQAQTNSRAVQTSLDAANRELAECHEQLRLLQKVFDPEMKDSLPQVDGAKPDLSRAIDMARKLETSQSALTVANERANRAELQLDHLRSQHHDELQETENRLNNSKRALLEEMNNSQVNARSSPAKDFRREWDARKTFSPVTTPSQSARNLGNHRSDSARSDRTTDTITYNNRMDLAAELEMVQNQLQMSEMKNRHLQAQIDRTSPSKNGRMDDSPSVGRMKKLERENLRLHDMLDDSAKKVSALEQSVHNGHLTFHEVQSKSHQELFDLINSREQSRKVLVASHRDNVGDLATAKTAFEDLKQLKNTVEVELRDAKSELAEVKYEREQDAASHSQLLQEFNDMQIRLDTETSKLVDVTSSLQLYRARADEYFSKLEQAEIAVLKASRAEQFAKSQAKEVEETCASIMSERKQMDTLVEDLQRQSQQFEERMEDIQADLDAALQAKKRLQNELEDYRSQRAMDIEDKETGLEQTRRKYQNELASVNQELEIERDNIIHARTENGRLRDELEELRNKWDDEVLNSSAWAKEKSRLDVAMQDLSNSRDEAANAHNEAQSKIVNLLSQVRTLRTNMDDAVAERDLLMKEKKGLESRLAEAADRLQSLSTTASPTKRDVALSDKEVLQLKSQLAQQEDIATAAIGKMRRAELMAQETQKDIASERETSVRLHREKADIEKMVKELQLKCIDLETKGYSSASQDVRYLNSRVQELESQLEDLESTRATEARSVRNVDRTVKDLQSQIERREKSTQLLGDDLNKARDKIGSLLATIDELQATDSSSQLAAKRAERELREEKEKVLRLERELEGWKGLRLERNSVQRSGTLAALSDDGRSRRGSSIGPPGGGYSGIRANADLLDVPQRMPSLSKGFL
ncbi:hypothetical protein ANO11243_036260 [Dothideomycetidae sp. 11243]|nr:hypothetical protein ANO11243_036260 [fungal sp. No.11243]